MRGCHPFRFCCDGGRMFSDQAGNGNRRTIHATCTVHGGTPGFTNLRVSQRGRGIEFDPHVTGACLIRLDENGARTLCAVLTEWLG